MRAAPDASHVAHWIGQRGLRELAAVFTAAANAGSSFVSCDSGPLHLAVACGLRTVALAGPQDARRTGPYPGSEIDHAVMRSERELECAPCLARHCQHPEGPVCMSDLGVAAVKRALPIPTHEGVTSPCA